MKRFKKKYRRRSSAGLNENNLPHAVAYKCVGLSKGRWKAVVHDIKELQPFQNAVAATGNYCVKSIEKPNGNKCRSQLCPVCYGQRVRLLVKKLLQAIDNSRVGKLYVERVDSFIPATDSQYNQIKLRNSSAINWSSQSPIRATEQLNRIREIEHNRLADAPLLFTPTPLGVLSTWYVWPVGCGWQVTCVRFAAFPRSAIGIKSRVQRRQRFQKRDNAVVTDFSPDNLFNLCVSALRQPRGLLSSFSELYELSNKDYVRMLPAAALLLPPPKNNLSHIRSTGIFRQQKRKIVMSKNPFIAALQTAGITVGSQQEFWLYQFANTVQMFPEITFKMFCERLANISTIGPDGKKPVVTYAEEQFKQRRPDDKQPARIAAVCDYCDARELFMTAGSHLSLSAYFATNDSATTPPTTDHPILQQLLDPNTSPSQAFAMPATPESDAAMVAAGLLKPAALPQPVVEAPNSTPAAPKRKRGKSAATAPAGRLAANSRGIYTGHTPPSLAGKVLSPVLATESTKLKGLFMTDCGQFIEFTEEQVVPDSSPQPGLPPNAQNFKLMVTDDEDAEYGDMLTRGVRPELFTTDKLIGTVDVGEGLMFNLYVVAADPPYADGVLHNPQNIDPSDGTIIPVAEIAPRMYSMTGEYTFQLGSRTVVVSVAPPKH